MIELKHLTLQLGTRKIFDGLDLKVDRGEKLGIIGGEGAGKTTLLDLIAGRVLPTEGTVCVSGQILTINRDIYSDFSEINVAEMSAAEKFKMTLLKVLDDTGSADKILLLDEPTKNLDGDDVDRLIELLKKRASLTVIAASNDRYFLNRLCNRTLTLGESGGEPINLISESVRKRGEPILNVEKLLKIVDGETVFQHVSFTVRHGQKIALVGKNEVGKSKLIKVLGAGIPINKGQVQFAPNVRRAYMPRVFSSAAAKTELFKLRNCGAELLILDNPTSCLDLPTIQALEKALVDFDGTIVFADSDREFIQAIANRIIDVTPDGIVDRIATYDEFLNNYSVRRMVAEKYF